MKLQNLVAVFAISIFFIAGCKTDGNDGHFIPDPIKKPSDKTKNSGDKGISFDRPDGVYTKGMAEADFGVPIEMNWQNMEIVDNQARVRIPANTLSQGNIVNIDVPDGTEYELSFKVKFGEGFDWSRGGKVGFGFHIGNGYTGCNKADDGLGGTARLMWYNAIGTKTNHVTTGTYFRPYVYYKDMPESCGDNFGKQSKRITTNTWYTVKIRVKSNTGSNT